MMKNEIGCGVCRDLLPLVEDGIASEESTVLVEEHLRNCPECRDFASGNPSIAPKQSDFSNPLRRLKAHLLVWAGSFLLIGCLCGVLIGYSAEMFYNFLLMPGAGAAGYCLFRKKCWIIPLAVAGLSYLWQTAASLLTEGIQNGIFIAHLPFALIYAVLSCIGILIAALLKFAFRKEDFHDDKKTHS
ncbi:MAG: zf-HC2 domain-containing protein [Candidatus Merdivicinus sp.]